MSEKNNPSPFFGSYNARHINAEEVADQFVPSGKFWELIALRNSLLIGPRGSGKTHLLKMLQPKALAAWQAPEAERARDLVEYWGVFTPADINWKMQVDQKSMSLSEDIQQKFSNAVFLSHFRESFISCLLQLTRDRPQNDSGQRKLAVKLDKESEVSLCISLAKAWELELGIPSLEGLKVGIVGELAYLGRSASHERLSPYMVRLLSMNLLGVAKEIAEHFIQVTRLYTARWALCFDELEIAPPEIQKNLFEYLRSTDQRFIFKLAISPSNDASGLLNSEGAASAGNDYDAIPLWFTDQRERELFCSLLWEKQSAGTPAKNLLPQAILQRSRFQYSDTETAHGSRRYQGRDSWQLDFQELERKDPSFAEYLRKNSVQSDYLESTSREKMNSIVRKVAPLVGFRNAYFGFPKRDGVHLPLRKPLKRAPTEIFSGWEALCTATEGNPRWFSGIASRLILKWSGSPSGKELTREQQTQELESAARKFLAWINAIPIDASEYYATQLSLYGLILLITSEFEQSVLGKNFTADPILAFKVDEATPIPVRKLVMAALNIGAIVVFDDEENFTLASLVGRTFRIVHLLAPHFNIPMRKGKSRNLSSILIKKYGSIDKFQGKVLNEEKGDSLQQLGLFK